MRCILKEAEAFGGGFEIQLRVSDPKQEVWSPRDADGIWGTSLTEEEEFTELKNFLSDEDKKKVDEFFDEASENWYEDVVLEVDNKYWKKMGYTIRENVSYEGEPVAVTVPMTLDSVAHVGCPYCSLPRAVEPDARYVVTCEGCGDPYRVVSLI